LLGGREGRRGGCIRAGVKGGEEVAGGERVAGGVRGGEEVAYVVFRSSVDLKLM
jgi:hypothetical protein